MKRIILTILASLVVNVFSAFALTNGYYRILNTKYSRYMSEELLTHGLCTTTTMQTSQYNKVWKVTVSDNKVSLQNVYTHNFVTSTEELSQYQYCTSKESKFALTDKGSSTYMLGSYLHCSESQGYNVVYWDDSASEPSVWKFEEATDVTSAIADQAFNDYSAQQTINDNYNTYNTRLSNFFTDLSCSKLLDSFQNYDDGTLRQKMADGGLTTDLQEIGVKVKNQWQDETIPAQSQRFRVRDYKAYSRAEYWRSKLYATQFTDMNNPTGICCKEGDKIYVFVGGEVPSGTTLYMATTTGTERASYNTGMQLHKGVNTFQAGRDYSSLWVMYTTSSETTKPLDMGTLKLHIEGGTPVGFYDSTGKDEDEANAEYKEIMQAALQIVPTTAELSSYLFQVKGDRGMFNFPLATFWRIWAATKYSSSDVYTADYRIWKSIRYFDNALKWEWNIMDFMEGADGTQTALYPTYCNNLALTMQGTENSNPYSTVGYTAMPGIAGIYNAYMAERTSLVNWVVGHESGHNNQDLIKLPATTESSNNLFSNIVTYQYGYLTSRGGLISDCAYEYTVNKFFLNRDIANTHRLYYQLYLWAHMAGNKPDFYPTLFRLLRESPMKFPYLMGTTEYNTDATVDDGIFKFIRYCCQAANKNLSEFFSLYGLLQTCSNVDLEDYGKTYHINITQTQVDNLKTELQQKYGDPDHSLIFIEDRIETSYRTDWHTKTSTSPRIDQESDHAVGSCGKVGSVNEYRDGGVNANHATYKCTFSSNSRYLAMNGTGGVGFWICDGNDKLYSFTNNTWFTVPTSMTSFRVWAINADNTKLLIYDSANPITTYTVSISSSDNNMGTVAFTSPRTASTSISVASGTTVTATATVVDGYEFTGWTSSTSQTPLTSQTYTFTVTGDVSLTANFQKKAPQPSQYFTVSVKSADQTEGFVSFADGSTADKKVAEGTEVTVQATPTSDYVFDSWTDTTGKFLTGQNPYTFVVNSNLSLVANFNKGYIVSASTGSLSDGSSMGYSTWTSSYSNPGLKFTQNGQNIDTGSYSGNTSLRIYVSKANTETPYTLSVTGAGNYKIIGYKATFHCTSSTAHSATITAEDGTKLNVPGNTDAVLNVSLTEPATSTKFTYLHEYTGGLFITNFIVWLTNTTGIDEVEKAEKVDEGYNLLGQPTNVNSYKGIIIQKNKKINIR